MAARRRFNSVWSGLVPGLLLPVVTLVVIGSWRFDGGLQEFLTQFQRMQMLDKVVSLSALPNLLLFFVFIWTHRSYAARGVILATFLVAAVMLVLKFN